MGTGTWVVWVSDVPDRAPASGDGSDDTASTRPNDHLAAIVDALPDALFHLDGEGRVLDCRLGQATELAQSVRPERLIGMHIADETMPGVPERVMAALTRALETGEVVTCDFDLQRSPRAPRSSWRARFSRCGPDEVISVVSDITEERCRRDADQFLVEVSRAVIAENAAGSDAAVTEALRRTAEFVGGRGAVVLEPDDDHPREFVVADAYLPEGAPADVPSSAPGRPTWLATTLRVLPARSSSSRRGSRRRR